MRSKEKFVSLRKKVRLKQVSPIRRNVAFRQMKRIAESISGIIRRQMQHGYKQSAGWFSLTWLLAVCLVMAICVGPTAAQGKKSKSKPPAASRSSPSKSQSRARKASATKEPELQLEQLPPDPAVENADISITAHVKARSLKFETVPNPTVEFSGQPARDTVWEAQRENLPTPVEPGVTYRNIGVRLKITSVFRDIDRIVAEALGEVPVTDDAKSSTAPTQAQGSSSVKKSDRSSQAASSASPNSLPASTPPVKERP
jgi:hypothetical protein